MPFEGLVVHGRMERVINATNLDILSTRRTQEQDFFMLHNFDTLMHIYSIILTTCILSHISHHVVKQAKSAHVFEKKYEFRSLSRLRRLVTATEY